MNRLNVALLCAASVVALSTGASAQTASDTPTNGNSVETVTVTGSLVISDIRNSPTPVTAVSPDLLETTSPNNLATALEQLPAFLGSQNARANATSTTNGQADDINLRDLGITRTLTLFDGHRVAPSSPAGGTDIDNLPQMLISRVDVVTGGASATYGSDAVSGVVNYVLDKDFTGIKYEMQGGISTYADGAQQEVGVAGGTDLFGGRGHLEGDVRYFNQDLINNNARPYYANGQAWTDAGAGTAANPFVNTPYSRLVNQADGGGVVTCSGCAANWTTFTPGGALIPFNQGTPTGTPGTNSGGDGGGYYNTSSFQARLRQAESFVRFSYDINDSVTAYVEANADESYTIDNASATTINPGPGRGSVLPITDPYLTPAVQAQLASGNKNGLFTFGTFFDEIGGAPVVENGDDFRSANLDRSLGGTVGLDGTLFDKYSWDVFATYNENRLEGAVPHNANVDRFLAGEDAVAGPNGSIVCAVSLTSYSSLYPGCTPINPFGADSVTQGAFNWYTQKTSYEATNSLLDFGGSINGNVFDLPAGPVKLGLSGEYRREGLTIESNFNPAITASCVGFSTFSACAPGAALYDQTTMAPLAPTYIDVWEVAGEANVPLLHDLPMVQSLAVDIAGRYTDYSTSGAAETWKLALDYHINDSIRLRSTYSADIRAPNIYELHQPLTVNTGPYADILTGGNFSIEHATTGNPNLVPETAHTFTGGAVFTPTFIPNLSVSVDYFQINMANAITALTGSTAGLQVICDGSGGTSPYCALTSRPYPYTNTTLANYPTEYFTENVNSAKVATEGTDIEIDYHFDMSDVLDGVPGSVVLRNYASDQPYISTVNYPGSPATYTAIPKGRDVAIVDYKINSWSINLQNNWFSGFSRVAQAGQVFQQPEVPDFDTLNVTIEKDTTIGDSPVTLFLSVQNIWNETPPLDPTSQTNPGVGPVIAVGENGIGRYFMIGLKGAL
jgi:iron complex outermembrane recepter protein